jgi:poly(3-hydroxybutyrate) depolymerase
MKIIPLLFFVISLGGCHQSTGQQAKLLQKGFKNWYLGDFRCGVYIPPSYDPAKKYPLVIYLHGKNDTVSHNFGWYHEPIAMADPVILITPKSYGSIGDHWGNSWTDDIMPAMKKTFEIIEMVKKQYNVDGDRIYIHGTSMGAIGTFGLIQKFPDMFAAGYAVCGWGDPKIAPELSKVPFWIFHGEKDDIVPVQGSRGVYQAVLQNGGKQIRYTEFKDVKHDAWNHVDDKKVYAWLLAQRKGIKSTIPQPVNNAKATFVNDKINLTWQTNLTDHSLWYYKIYRDGKLIGKSDSLSFTDLLPVNEASYDYQISAVNYHFRESQPVEVTMSVAR